MVIGTVNQLFHVKQFTDQKYNYFDMTVGSQYASGKA